ncbi:PREDICTED: odorant receptor 94a-like [Ceratosolen solmsi marchali]|uniref:Odorant receptor n=1 Tax=Ceratosolen solmsi marchali TaxID=326594 RepID=A0AAJ6YSG7_9HYME|nr:PREDICTED: odorant receptor 94a-like [Ceratosolen solmsi marchali]
MHFYNSIEYHYLPIPFAILTICGTWCPENFSTISKQIYKLFTIVSVFLGIILFVEILIDVILSNGTIYFKLDNIFAVLVFSVGLYKTINVLCYRSMILSFITDYVDNQWYRPRNVKEIGIQQNMKSKTRWLFAVYTILIITSMILRSLTPILESKKFINLPFVAWYPYKIDNPLSFWLTYCHQIISGATLSCMHLSTDTLFVGFLLHMNCQINILIVRLKDFGNESAIGNDSQSEIHNEVMMKMTMAKLVREHQRIYRYGYTLQKTFEIILMGQLIVVVPNFLINIYSLSIYIERLDLKYFMTIFFTIISVMQIGMLCWYGNDILLGSKDIGNALYECNWTTVNQQTKKILLMMIVRTSKPLFISVINVIPINISTLLRVMKMSYSTFNLIQRTSAQ